MYHDVVADADHDASGFPGKWANLYKLDQTQFARHLSAIRDAIGDRPPDLVEHRDQWLSRRPFFLTFDDGGVSAHSVTAGLLEQHGWRGHFFVTTDRIDTPRFLNHDQLRGLRQRGHVIGSHSCSHPQRISSCSDAELAHEWGESTRVLAEIIGEPIIAASVPGGFYSDRVAGAAAAAGIRYLFTSEPTDKTWIVDDCLVLGRYFVQRDTSAELAADFARGSFGPRAKQAAWWSIKKAVKSSGGAYFRLKELLMRR